MTVLLIGRDETEEVEGVEAWRFTGEGFIELILSEKRALYVNLNALKSFRVDYE